MDLSRANILRRVLVKEVLRQAFARVVYSAALIVCMANLVRLRAGSNRHRARQAAPTVDGMVADWIQQNAPIIEHTCDVLLAFAKPVLVQKRADLITWIRESLITEITDIANDNAVYVQTSLSERLANAGLLPMFGFPTRTRFLFHADPTRSRQWPPEDAVDRDLDLAISQFAPGAETVKDELVDAAVGVVNYQRSRPASDPGFRSARHTDIAWYMPDMSGSCPAPVRTNHHLPDLRFGGF